MLLYIIRHGQTVMNGADVMNGHSHDILNEIGIEQANKVANKIAHITFDAMRASDLHRASDTAQAIVDKNSSLQTYTPDERLRERDTKHFDGKPIQEAKDAATAFGLKLADYLDHEASGVETGKEMVKRFNDWYDECIKDKGYENVLVVSHGGFIRTIVSEILHLPGAQFFDHFKSVENTSITIMKIDDEISRKRIVTYNDYSHLL